MKGKRGDILIGDVIFLVLNLIFLSILVIFLVSKTNDASIMEEKYAKQIALIIDSAKPGVVALNMEDAIEKAKDENQDIDNIVKIEDNLVTVKLRDKGGYSYSFFNDVDVNSYPDVNNGRDYVFIINKKTEV